MRGYKICFHESFTDMARGKPHRQHGISHFYVKKKVTHISNRLTVYRNVAVVGSYIVTFDSLTGGF